MKFSLLASLLFFSSSVLISASPYGDGMNIHFTQPGGQKINLLVKGSAYYARTVTQDGYTVVYSLTDGAYHYATLNAAQTALIPTSLIVGRDQPVGLEKEIKLPKAIETEKREKRYNEINAESLKNWDQRVKVAAKRRANKKESSPQVSDEAAAETENFLARASSANTVKASSNVTKKGLTILVQFPDDPETTAVDPVTFPSAQQKIERYCNELGYSDDGNTNSIRGYFRDQSEGALDYTMKVTSVITLPHPKNYYNYADYPTNKLFRKSTLAGNHIVRDAVKVLSDSGFDFSGLSIKNGNKILCANLLFAGSNSGVWTRGLWPHRWTMKTMNAPVIINGITYYVDDYQISSVPNDKLTIGTFIHESGHLLFDFPDLYDLGGESSGIGRHGLMANGSLGNGERTPGPINLYFKDILGWAHITDLSSSSFYSKSIPTTGNIGYRIRKPGANHEYFLIENRGDGDPWATYAPDKGIMIWHIDEKVRGNEDQQMTSSQHYQVSLEQSDGQFDLEKRDLEFPGDNQDLFDHLTPLFTDHTLPDAKWWDGSNSGIQIRVVSAPGSMMKVEFGDNPPRVVVDSPNGGESIEVDSSLEIKWHGRFSGNVKIDLYRNGSFLQTIATDQVNDGSYHWDLGGNFLLGSGYSILITSLDNPNNKDASESPFSIFLESHWGGGIMPSGWVKSTNADAGWIVVNDEVADWSYSLKNEDIGDNQKAEIEYSGLFEAGSISFKAKVSSEWRWDLLYFYIDGVRQDIELLESDKEGLSGEVDWRQVSINVSAGQHTFKWSYKKDKSASKGADSAWIDAIVMPPFVRTGFALWKDEQFGSETGDDAIAGDHADPDGDGISNILEYAFNLNPKVSDRRLIKAEVSGTEVALVYQRNPHASDLTYTIESSEDMKTWNPIIVTKEVITTENGNQTIKSMCDMENKKRLFLRVSVINQ